MKIQSFVEVVKEKFNKLNPYFRGTRTRDISTVDTVVLHWTAGSSVRSDIDVLQSKNFGYHFLIDKAGQIYQGSPINKVVSHAGQSYGPRGEFVNGHSIGISFSMLGTQGPSEYTTEMFESCLALIQNLKPSVPNLKYITGHHWVSPGRKIDPYTFDFESLMNELGPEYELWKTGDFPFPKGLRSCKCVKFDDNDPTRCIKSEGKCKGRNTENGYSKRNLNFKVSDISFQSDLDTN
jgi:N-acetyl-anhydromuramyl-L-alanine amidase AmpD